MKDITPLTPTHIVFTFRLAVITIARYLYCTNRFSYAKMMDWNRLLYKL